MFTFVTKPNFWTNYFIFVVACIALAIITSNLFDLSGKDIADTDQDFAWFAVGALLSPIILTPGVFIIWLLQKLKNIPQKKTPSFE